MEAGARGAASTGMDTLNRAMRALNEGVWGLGCTWRFQWVVTSRVISRWSSRCRRVLLAALELVLVLIPVAHVPRRFSQLNSIIQNPKPETLNPIT